MDDPKSGEDSTESPGEELPLMHIHTIQPKVHKKGALLVDINLDGKPLSMEVDTGASVSLISEATWRKLSPNRRLKPSSVWLRTYTGQEIKILGQVDIPVEHRAQKVQLPLVVVEGRGPSLFGRNWLEKIKVDWERIHSVQSEVDQILEKYETIIQEKLGTIKGVSARLELKSDARPKFCKARAVPYALKEAIENDLNRLEGLGIIEKVNISDWANPLVPVVKPDGSVRLCGDYKITVNPVLQVDHYPMPTPEDLFATLAGGTLFSKIDLSQAYNQVLLEPESREYLTVNTHKGLYRYTRLPFGVASAPSRSWKRYYIGYPM